MPEPLTSSGPPQVPSRPFPWSCPKCRRKEVRRTTIPYQCQRTHNGQSITVVLPALAVPRCEHCGELVFDYEAEQQINRAYQLQKDAAVDVAPPTATTTPPAPPASRRS